jgi:hypothetical protein
MPGKTQNVIGGEDPITSRTQVEKGTAMSRANSDGARVRMVQRKPQNPTAEWLASVSKYMVPRREAGVAIQNMIAGNAGVV